MLAKPVQVLVDGIIDGQFLSPDRRCRRVAKFLSHLARPFLGREIVKHIAIIGFNEIVGFGKGTESNASSS